MDIIIIEAGGPAFGRGGGGPASFGFFSITQLRVPHPSWFSKGGHDAADIEALTLPIRRSRLTIMEVNFRPETESRLQELATKSGRPPSDLIEDAMAGYLQEVTQVREMLDGRYDDLKNGRVKPVDGEQAFAKLRQKSKERRAGS